LRTTIYAGLLKQNGSVVEGGKARKSNARNQHDGKGVPNHLAAHRAPCAVLFLRAKHLFVEAMAAPMKFGGRRKWRWYSSTPNESISTTRAFAWGVIWITLPALKSGIISSNGAPPLLSAHRLTVCGYATIHSSL
jgi:hypothetical protein